MYLTQEQRMRDEIERRGLTVRPWGKGFLIKGNGVEILVSTLTALGPGDLTPAPETRFSRNQPTEGKL
jgi:hypothetical protein